MELFKDPRTQGSDKVEVLGEAVATALLEQHAIAVTGNLKPETRNYSTTASTSPELAVAPSFTMIFRTTPFLADFSSFCIFMASMTRIPWPCSTALPSATSNRTTLPGMGAVIFCGPWPSSARRVLGEHRSATSALQSPSPP